MDLEGEEFVVIKIRDRAPNEGKMIEEEVEVITLPPQIEAVVQIEVKLQAQAQALIGGNHPKEVMDQTEGVVLIKAMEQTKVVAHKHQAEVVAQIVKLMMFLHLIEGVDKDVDEVDGLEAEVTTRLLNLPPTSTSTHPSLYQMHNTCT